jgi:stearoyl-CoA desaturase (delta-9 desaturase)
LRQNVARQRPRDFAVGLLIELALGGSAMEAVQFGASIWLWGVVVRTVFVWHITWSVNSFSHVFGYQNYETNDHSRNNAFVAFISSGEGWHNNHHAEPGSACNQRHW